MRRNQSSEAEATIDMAPLIDIVFILLIFYGDNNFREGHETGAGKA